MHPKKVISNSGSKVTKSVFSGAGRRLSDGKEILKSNKRKAGEADDGYNEYHQEKEFVKGKKRKIEDSDDEDDYREGEIRERHNLNDEALELYPKTQTRSGLCRGLYKYGKGRVLAESGPLDSGRDRSRLEPTPPEEEIKGTQ